jgi:hypothetical protein
MSGGGTGDRGNIAVMRNFYQEVREYSQEEALACANGDMPCDLHVVVVGVAFYEVDADFAEEFCLRLVSHDSDNVRGNAILGFGHIARRFGKLESEQIRSLVERALKDESDYVRGQAWAAASDITHFLGWSIDGFST